jgi:hypothetical protein
MARPSKPALSDIRTSIGARTIETMKKHIMTIARIPGENAALTLRKT